jgi:MOSC domain-containing protein YiiM
MKLISVNVGLPRDVVWRGQAVRTSIWKTPVEGPVPLSGLNVRGDEQSDLSVHGGPDKAIYVYPSEHYSYWRSQLPDLNFPWGAFGENFTTEGLPETEVQVGDRLRAGSADFVVTQPRIPCYKLAVRFDRPDMVKRFLESGRTGFYLKVLHEGKVTAGDPIEYTRSEESGLTIADIVNLYTVDSENQELLRRAAQLPALPEGWREYFRKRLWDADA